MSMNNMEGNLSHGGDQRLEHIINVVAENFRNGAVMPIGDREIIERVEKNRGEISGRTALIAGIVLEKYTAGLKRRNSEIRMNLDLAQPNINRANLEEEFEKNSNEIEMLEGNCLGTLREINDNILKAE